MRLRGCFHLEESTQLSATHINHVSKMWLCKCLQRRRQRNTDSIMHRSRDCAQAISARCGSRNASCYHDNTRSFNLQEADFFLHKPSLQDIIEFLPCEELCHISAKTLRESSASQDILLPLIPTQDFPSRTRLTMKLLTVGSTHFLCLTNYSTYPTRLIVSLQRIGWSCVSCLSQILSLPWDISRNCERRIRHILWSLHKVTSHLQDWPWIFWESNHNALFVPHKVPFHQRFRLVPNTSVHLPFPQHLQSVKSQRNQHINECWQRDPCHAKSKSLWFKDQSLSFLTPPLRTRTFHTCKHNS